MVVKGLPESELPIHEVADGVRVVAVPGWGVGAGVNPEVGGEGYIVFVRGDTEGALKQVYSWYFEKVVEPFVERRRNFVMQDQGGWKKGQPVPPEYFAVGRADGEMNQLAAMVRADRLQHWTAMALCHNKVPAADTANTNALDNGPVFRCRKMKERSANSQDFAVVEATQRQFEAVLKRVPQLRLLSVRRLKAYTNFMAVLPSIDQESCTQQKAISGFIDVGFLIERGVPWPNFEKMAFEVVRRCVLAEERHLVVTHLDVLMDEQFKKGQITDTTFTRLGFQPDLTPDNVYAGDRPEGSLAEHMQRAKCLTHEAQVSDP